MADLWMVDRVTALANLADRQLAVIHLILEKGDYTPDQQVLLERVQRHIMDAQENLSELQNQLED